MRIRFSSFAQISTVLVASVTMLAAPAAVASPTSVSAPSAVLSCSTNWGSTAESAGTLEQGTLQGLRAGRHACFDRLVVDMSGVAPGYTVKYVNKVRREGRGDVVSVAGGARLLVVAHKGIYAVTTLPRVGSIGLVPRSLRRSQHASNSSSQVSALLSLASVITPWRQYARDRSQSTLRHARGRPGQHRHACRLPQTVRETRC